MALQKQVKVGGSYFKGFELIVSSAVGTYIKDIKEPVGNLINSVSVTPDAYGVGDTFTLAHLSSDTATVYATLAASIFNPGAGVSTLFDFPALEKMEPNNVFRLSYVNTATVAVNVHMIVEYIGMIKTA